MLDPCQSGGVVDGAEADARVAPAQPLGPRPRRCYPPWRGTATCSRSSPQVWRVREGRRLLLSVVLGVELVQVAGVNGRGDDAHAGGSDYDPGHRGEGALGGGLVAVEGRAGGEDGDGDGEAKRGERVADGPADVVLDVDEDGVGEERAEEDVEHPPSGSAGATPHKQRI